MKDFYLRNKKLVLVFLFLILMLGSTIFLWMLNRLSRQTENISADTQEKADKQTILKNDLRITPVQKEQDPQKVEKYIQKVAVEEKVEVSEIENHVSQAQAVYEQASFTPLLKSFILPTGDTFELRKSDFGIEGTPQFYLGNEDDYVDIKYKMKNPKENYTAVLYEAPYIRNYQPIYKGVDFEGYEGYYSFDARDLSETGNGLLLIYPENVLIDPDKLGMPDGALLAIPITL